MKYCWCLLPIAMLFVGCANVNTAGVEDNRNWSSTNVALFRAETENGAITINTWTNPEIAAKITKSCRGSSESEAGSHLKDIVVTESTVGDVLFLRADVPSSNSRSYTCEFAVSVPTNMSQRLFTKNGAVKIGGIIGDINIETTNGAVTITNTIGAITLQTSNGAVTLNNNAGPASVVTSNGRVSVTSHQGSIIVNSSNGVIDCDLSRFDLSDVAVLRTSHGRVSVTLPADVSVAFDASTDHGSVEVRDFPVNYTLSDPTHKRGTISSGLAALTIETTSGNVVISRR
jgi:hypothetical protein